MADGVGEGGESGTSQSVEEKFKMEQLFESTTCSVGGEFALKTFGETAMIGFTRSMTDFPEESREYEVTRLRVKFCVSFDEEAGVLASLKSNIDLRRAFKSER